MLIKAFALTYIKKESLTYEQKGVRMDTITFIPTNLDLQLFADSGAAASDGGTGSEGSQGVNAAAALPQTKGVKTNPLADVKYGISKDEPQNDKSDSEPSPAAEVSEAKPQDRNARFEELIKGEFKDLYDAKVQSIVQKRLKGTAETVDKYNALSPTLELLASKYGVDVSDIKALNKAIENDSTLFEEEAIKNGMSVEQYKEFRDMKRQNAAFQRQEAERARRAEFDAKFKGWMDEAKEVSKLYPSLDLKKEFENDEFFKLLNSGIGVKAAYQAVHFDDIMSAGMQHAARVAEQKVTNKVIANGARPAENGNSSQAASQIKSDVSQLSKADIDEIMRRVRRGENISFG